MLPSEGQTRDFINKHQQNIFSLALSLVGGDKNAAYDITVASFAQVIPTMPLGGKEDRLFCRLVRALLKESQEAKIVPSRGETDFPDLPPDKRRALELTRRALQKLPLATKGYLLLRDQLHLPYKTIAAIERVSERQAKIQVAQARGELRGKLEGILRVSA